MNVNHECELVISPMRYRTWAKFDLAQCECVCLVGWLVGSLMASRLSLGFVHEPRLEAMSSAVSDEYQSLLFEFWVGGIKIRDS